MSNTFFLLLLASLSVSVFPYQNAAVPQDGSAIAILEYKWAKTRLAVGKVAPANPPPAMLVTQASKNYERTKPNQPRGARDPSEDTYEGRSAAIEKNIQESRAPKPVDGFAYRIKVQNTSKKVADIIFWEYQFIDQADPAIVTRRQFLCAVKMNPSKTTEIEALSVAAPVEVVSVAGLANDSWKSLQEKVVINRVEYVDGSIWRRKDWNFGEIKHAYDRAVATPWAKEMCRPL